MPPPADPPRPVFKLRPDRMSLSPGQSQEVVLEGFSEKCVIAFTGIILYDASGAKVLWLCDSYLEGKLILLIKEI